MPTDPLSSALTLPFRYRVYRGLGLCAGLLRLSGGQLSIEYRLTYAGVAKRHVQVIHIPLNVVEEVDYRQPWLDPASLMLRLSRLDLVDRMPGQSAAEFLIGIPKSKRELARKFAAALEYEVSNAKLRH
ncbi:MAG: hypothetical protein ACFB21_01015 [Opitutales bacterium]